LIPPRSTSDEMSEHGSQAEYGSQELAANDLRALRASIPEQAWPRGTHCSCPPSKDKQCCEC